MKTKKHSKIRQTQGVTNMDEEEKPRSVHGVGFFYPSLFGGEKDYYDAITTEHKLQDLKLGSKPGTAFRQGIYLTPVWRVAEDKLRFSLLRCSTNLDGPTDNFRATDDEIVAQVNELRKFCYPMSAEFNHVLAQTYHNSVAAVAEEEGEPPKQPKEHKARIAVHSDKTKDMPRNGMMAFCSFYRGYSAAHGFAKGTIGEGVRREGLDYVYGKGATVLTKLRFKLKSQAAEDPANANLVREFDLTLYPNSVFLMPLWTNRMYTHEIVPSSLPVDKIPTRLGYVVRCSNTLAEYDSTDEQTYILEGPQRRKLEPPTKEGLEELRALYFKENTTIEEVSYQGKFYFSMNEGDYQRPME